MNSRTLFPVFIRLISRSSVQNKVSSLGSSKDISIKIEDEDELPVEKDTEKLAKYVCGTNLFIDGGEDIKLKEDSEYPDWLWQIEPPLPFEKLSPDTKIYWMEVAKMRLKENKYLLTLQKHKTVQK